MNTQAMFEIFKLRRLCKRIRKLNRTFTKRSVIIILTVAIIYICLFILIIYHIHHILLAQNHPNTNQVNQRMLHVNKNYDTPMRHIRNNEIYTDYYNQEDDSIEIEESRPANMIKTPGCVIPVVMVNYNNYTWKKKKDGCGTRMIYMRKNSEDIVQATIRDEEMIKLMKNNLKYDCCYRFFQKSKTPGSEHLKIQYTSCKNLKNGEKFRLKSDFINVQCFEYDVHNKSYLIYDDDYVFCKRITLSDAKRKVNQEKYNVLVIGLDSMSLPRFSQTMTRTVNFFQSHNWQSYRGYHKVGDNTLPNLIPALTGKHSSEIFKNCYRRMDSCNHYLLWSLFKKSGYVTAYGEDYLELPDTFSREFMFKKSPTDHYMRPFFLNREYDMDNRSILCSGKITSGKQVLDFAYDFAFTYRNDSFFGFFWINSFSHNIISNPRDADLLLEDFFNRLIYTGVLDNTFIVFMSDHGIRFGKPRMQIESYYDNRLPFLFFWIPNEFKLRYPEKLKGLLINQFRLTTPYDLFATLVEIKNLANNNSVIDQDKKTKNYGIEIERQSMLKIISDNRTCKNVGIHEKFCSCHNLYPLDVADEEAIKSVYYVESYMKTALRTVKTKRCWSCSNISLQNISRIHFYYDSDKINLYYVVAFSMSPNNRFYEAVVLRKNTRIALVGSINLISQYDGFGRCTIKRTDKIFCVCQRIYNCRISITF